MAPIRFVLIEQGTGVKTVLYARLVPTSVGGGGYVRVTAASIPPFLPPPSHSRCLPPPFVPIPTSQILHVSTRRGKDAAVVFNAELCGSLMDPRRSDFGAYCDLKCCMGPTSAYHIACYFQIYAAAYTRTRATIDFTTSTATSSPLFAMQGTI